MPLKLLDLVYRVPVAFLGVLVVFLGVLAVFLGVLAVLAVELAVLAVFIRTPQSGPPKYYS